MSIYADVTVREADFHLTDPWLGDVDVWFGETTVGIPSDMNPARVAYFAGWREKNGTSPTRSGIETDGDWDGIWDTLGAERTWLVAVVPSDDDKVRVAR